jgi:DNA-directed RNA polymerase sigma subunit (sigma70/sigma32)
VTDIAKGMKLSRERVRQLEKESLQLLRDACARGARRSERRQRSSAV